MLSPPSQVRLVTDGTAAGARPPPAATANKQVRRLRPFGFDGCLVRKIELSEATSTVLLFAEAAHALEVDPAQLGLSEDIAMARPISHDPSRSLGAVASDMICAFRKQNHTPPLTEGSVAPLQSDEAMARRLQEAELAGAQHGQERGSFSSGAGPSGGRTQQQQQQQGSSGTSSSTATGNVATLISAASPTASLCALP